MMAVTNPGLNARVSLRYSLLLVPLSIAAPAIGLTTWWFALDSTLVNGAMAFYAFKFWKDSNDTHARGLFFSSLLHLPLILGLLMLHKSDEPEEEMRIAEEPVQMIEFNE
jgi:protoheme IX farnesyltransferase